MFIVNGIGSCTDPCCAPQLQTIRDDDAIYITPKWLNKNIYKNQTNFSISYLIVSFIFLKSVIFVKSFNIKILYLL